jgi:hypothetical protein
MAFQNTLEYQLNHIHYLGLEDILLADVRKCFEIMPYHTFFTRVNFIFSHIFNRIQTRRQKRNNG